MKSVHIDSRDREYDGRRITLDSPEPSGYNQWHYWADLQAKAGRRQEWCHCGRLRWGHLPCKHCGHKPKSRRKK